MGRGVSHKARSHGINRWYHSFRAMPNRPAGFGKFEVEDIQNYKESTSQYDTLTTL